MTDKFKDKQKKHAIVWRKDNISSCDKGWQNGREYEHIIPKEIWEENLWAGIRAELNEYLEEKEVQAHTGVHNLLSSWVSCANLYFPVRIDKDFEVLMLSFLQKTVDSGIIEISQTELEFAFEGELSPSEILGEMGGNRGSGQTSPDVAFLVNTEKGEGVVLTECKYTEHSFYPCSARKIDNKKDRVNNSDPSRCMKPASGYNYKAICHQTVWGRKYWDNLEFSEYGIETLTRCPAATGGYQLFRQHSLAEGIAKSSEYDLVVSAVAFDGRNETLIRSNRTSGVSDFQTGWGKLFEGQAQFKTWTHQEWVEYVRENGDVKVVEDWLEYITNRYEY